MIEIVGFDDACLARNHRVAVVARGKAAGHLREQSAGEFQCRHHRLVDTGLAHARNSVHALRTFARDDPYETDRVTTGIQQSSAAAIGLEANIGGIRKFRPRVR